MLVYVREVKGGRMCHLGAGYLKYTDLARIKLDMFADICF